MPLVQDKPDHEHYIVAVEPGRIRIGEEDYRRSLIVSADAIRTDWAPTRLDEVTAANLAPALSGEPEVLLLGCGEEHAPAPPELLAHVLSKGIGFEVMTTAAACRTFNILLGEKRRVAAALIIETGRR